MSNTFSKDFENVASGNEIWSLEIQKLHFYFLKNGERYSHKIFRDGRSLDWGVHVGLWMSSVTSGPDRK